MELLVATRNEHKLAEIREIFDIDGLVLADLAAFPDLPEVVEDRETFAGNAVKKAVETARSTGQWALADDSGLEVEALGGAPGVYSARYAGEPADHEANNAKLLRELGNTDNRRARFRCVAALSDADGQHRCVEGVCEGTIAHAPRGRGGFGYDPLFIPDGRNTTFAEMTSLEKHRLSHRGKAFRLARRQWGSLLQASGV